EHARIRIAGVPVAACERDGDARHDCPRRLERAGGSPHQRHRRLRQDAAPEDRARRAPATALHRPGRGVRVEGRMMPRLTIRWRMTLWFGAALAAVLLAFGALTYSIMRHHLLEGVDAGLHEELSDVLSEIRRGNDRQAMLGWLDRRFARHEGFDFQVTTAAGERV